jgi:ADP-ribosylglycohydrolase
MRRAPVPMFYHPDRARIRTTGSFAAAVLQAANLGEDADTTAAVCGQIAGAHYGESGIPAHWRKRLTMRDEIASLADRLYSAGRAPASYS